MPFLIKSVIKVIKANSHGGTCSIKSMPKEIPQARLLSTTVLDSHRSVKNCSFLFSQRMTENHRNVQHLAILEIVLRCARSRVVVINVKRNSLNFVKRRTT